MNRVYTCILCPNSCEIVVDYDGVNIHNIQGNKCDNGREYVTQELIDPKRTLTSSVLVLGGDRPLASVRLNAPISRSLLLPLMDEIKGIVLKAPVEPGQVVLARVFGTDADLIATSHVKEKV